MVFMKLSANALSYGLPLRDMLIGTHGFLVRRCSHELHAVLPGPSDESRRQEDSCSGPPSEALRGLKQCRYSARWRIADRFPGAKVQNDRQVYENGCDPDIGNIGSPDLVEARDPQGFDQVRNAG